MEMSTPSRPAWIVTDSTADFPPGLIAGMPVTVVPLIVEIEGRSGIASI